MLLFHRHLQVYPKYYNITIGGYKLTNVLENERERENSLIWDSSDNPLHFSDVRVECLLTVSLISDLWLVKKKRKSLY